MQGHEHARIVDIPVPREEKKTDVLGNFVAMQTQDQTVEVVKATPQECISELIMNPPSEDLRSKTACCWRGDTRSGASRCFCQCSRVDQLLENIAKTFHDTRVDALSDEQADQQLAEAIQLAFSLSQQIKTALDQAQQCGDDRLQGKAQMVFETVHDYLSTLMKIHQAHRDVSSPSSLQRKKTRRRKRVGQSDDL